MPDIKHIVVQILPSSETGDGQITDGYYTVADGLLVMTTSDGSPVGEEFRLRPGDNERAIATVLTKKVRRATLGITEAEEIFNRPIRYANAGIA